MTTTDREVGVVIVGVGFIAGAHIAAIAATPLATLRGVVDADATRAASFAHANGGIPWATSLDAALGWPDVDAVIICTPNVTHEALAVAAARAGKHALVEKPLATTVDSAQRITAAFEASGTVVMAAHTHRFYDYGRSVRQVIDSGDIGTPLTARLVILGGWAWTDWNAWVLDPAKSGGHALHNGVHLLDLVTWWLGGSPVRVYARGAKQTSSQLDIYDYLEMTVELDTGASAVCEMSRAHRIGSVGHRELMVLGDRGLIEQDFDGDSSQIVSESGIGLVPNAAANGFAVQLAAWLDAIAGAEPLMTPDDAVRAVALGVAAEESIRTGQPVELAAIYEGVA